MNRFVLLGIFSLLALVAVGSETDSEVEARKTALDLAGAFTNDGFKLRDGHWVGTVQPQRPTVVAVNLYAGNQYWFTAGAADPARKVDVEIYDEAGHEVATENYEQGEKAAAGLSPKNSGEYYVSVSLRDGGPGSVCLVCSYK
jgi:hypothetical protein